MRLGNLAKLVMAVAVSEAAGVIGSVFTVPSIPSWYAGLVKPALSPPSWVFGPVWTALFALMGIALFLVWRQHSHILKNVRMLRVWRQAAVLFFTQLFLNVIWSVIFFGLHSPGGAFIEIIFLWFAIIAAIAAFAKVSKPAAWLLAPYILWVSFAAYLNFSIWRLSVGAVEPVACTMDAKLCSDGSYVARVPPDCNFAPCPKEDLIRVESPRPNEVIASPLTIKGEARGTWFFEAQFPAKLYDENGRLVAETPVLAKSDWMTRDFVSFEASLNFQVPAGNGVLVLEKSNPSGLPENADELKIPLVFGRKVKLYYYNPELDRSDDGNVLCSRKGLEAVERIIPLTKTPIQDTIKLLLSGRLTDEERDEGITTEYPLEGFALKSALLENGILTLAFDDQGNKTTGGSCRVGILWFQIEATAKQFPEVKQVRFLPEDIFQP